MMLPMNNPRAIRHAALLGALLLVFGSLPPAAAQDEHHHEHAGPAIEQLQLDDGAKWATDETLRRGMATIRSAFDAEHEAIRAGAESDARYAALASRIETAVQDIVENCKLPPAADANLHYIIADLMRSVNEMRGGEPSRTRRDGAVLVHGALEAYGQFFDDPAFGGAAAQVP